MAVRKKFLELAEARQRQRDLDAARPDIEALRRIEEEEVRRLQQLVYQKDPMSWLEEKFGESRLDYQWSLRPEYANHEWDGSVDPLYNAWMDLANRKWVGVESGTSTGKTRWVSRVVFWFLDNFPNSLVVTTAPKERQLDMGLWSEINLAFHKFKKIRPNAAMYKLRLVVDDSDANEAYDPDHPNWSKSWHAVGIVAGVGADETSATKMQGLHREHMLCIIEEAPGVPLAVLNALKNTSSAENNLILAVGNPDNITDTLHEFCMLPQVQNQHYRVSCHDHPNVVSRNPSLMPGATTLNFINTMLAEHGEKSSMYQSRVRGMSPSQASDSLIQKKWLDDCAQKEIPYDGSYHGTGVDVAQSEEGDKACVCTFKGPNMVHVKDFHCDNATHLAYNLYMTPGEVAAAGFSQYDIPTLQDMDIMPGFVGVDTVGVGYATLNPLMDAGWEPVALLGGCWDDVIPEEEYVDPNDGKTKHRKLYNFQNLRAQMWWEFREDCRKGLISFKTFAELDKDTWNRLVKEIISVRVIYRGNFIAIESKDEIKKRNGGKSPNLADGAVYANWVRKGYRFQSGGFPVLGGG